MRSLSVAATGMMAQQLHVEVISNNIANMTTTGYKRRRPEFQDLLYQSQRRIGCDFLVRGHDRARRRAARARRQDGGRLPDPRAGRLRQHREQLRPRDPGQRLLRGRASQRRARLHPLGQFPAQPRRPAGHARRLHGQPGDHRARRMPSRCRSTRKAWSRPRSRARSRSRSWASCSSRPSSTRPAWRPPAATCCRRPPPRVRPWPGRPAPRAWAPCCRASLESSNVNPVQEITALIAAQRAYDMNSKVISASDEMMATVTQLR